MPIQSPLQYKGQALCFQGIPLAQLAERFPTPFYVYSQSAVRGSCRTFLGALKEHWNGPFAVCYAMKANSHPRVLGTIREEGIGADVVSIGELELALKQGFPPSSIVFSGVGKTRAEIRRTLELTHGDLLALNVESAHELSDIQDIAQDMGLIARVALRANPKVKAGTHKHISTGDGGHKFGIDFQEARGLIRNMRKYPSLKFVGLSMHIGSQLTSIGPIKKALKALLALAYEEMAKKGHYPELIDVGGGLGIDYQDGQKIIHPDEFMKSVARLLKTDYLDLLPKGAPVPLLVFEPGRYLVARAGALVTSVVREKRAHGKRFTIVDAGMNDLLRPVLYEAFHRILPGRSPKARRTPTDVVGPVCESGDFFAKQRPLPALAPGDLLAIADAGAYGRSMSSNYNMRPFPSEVLVDDAGSAVL